jgi:hypothetical protein
LWKLAVFEWNSLKTTNKILVVELALEGALRLPPPIEKRLLPIAWLR